MGIVVVVVLYCLSYFYWILLIEFEINVDIFIYAQCWRCNYWWCGIVVYERSYTVLSVISTGMHDCLRVGIPIPYIHIYPMYVPCVPKKRPKKVCCVLSNVGGSEESQLWCVATGMSGKQCHSKCSEWPPSALVHDSSLFRHWSVAEYTTLCWNSARVATSRCRSSCSVPQTQYQGYAGNRKH